MPSGKADGLLADTLHQTAVARDAPGMVIDDLGPPTGAQGCLGHGKAHGIGQPLTKRAGGGFDPGGMAIFGVARRDRAQLPEIADLFQRHVGIAGQMQQRIQQHRAMARAQDEPVTIGPMRRAGIEFQMLLEQDRGDIGHAHRHAGMAGIGGGDGIERQGADTGGAAPVIGVRGGEGGQVQGRYPSFWRMSCCSGRDSRPGPKCKRATGQELANFG